MKNNNGAVIRRLTGRSLKSNKKRNFFIITAIALTTLLIASVFSIGMSLMESLKMQEIRLMGTVAHAAVSRPTAAQIEQLNRLDYVKTVSTCCNVASVKNTAQMSDANLSLFYFDKTEWEKSRTPAYTDITGSYPQKENEIMVPLWVLERWGINNPAIGMEIPLTYYIERGNTDAPVNTVFHLSGWFTSYMHIRSGNIDSILVSEKLAQKYGKTVETDGSATVIFDNSSRVLAYCEQLKSDLGVAEDQLVKPVPMYDTDTGTMRTNLIALFTVIAFFIFTGYLLIYNVLYISVSRDVRFYGLLKTLGTTPKQIRRIVIGQILRLCLIGIPIGAVLALLLSLVVVPAFLSKLASITTGTVVSFSPLIYLGAALFALLTALLGAFRPAKKAAGISPVEAQKFTGLKVNKSRVYSPAHGKPYKMAFRNIFRDRKRAVIVFLSLFLGVTTFITITTLVTSMDTDNYVASYVESDFVLQNNTMIGYEGETKQKFNDAFMNTIKSLPGFENLRKTTEEWMQLEYSKEEFGEYLADYIKKNDADDLTEQDVRKNFSGIIAGIDREALTALNKTAAKPIDVDAFERGEFALLSTGNPSLFQNVPELTISPMNKNKEGVFERSDSKSVKIPLGGFVPVFFERIGYSIAPTVFISNTLMSKLYEEPIIAKVNIDVAKGYDKQALDELKEVMKGDYEISRASKLEAQEELRGTKMMLYILGGGVALILALIGILNFINVMSVGIMVRKQELATFECIGMSWRQVRKMLVNEGIGYAAITLLLVFTAGSAITFGIFTLFQQQATYAVFTYPFIPVMIVGLAIIAICSITPEITYRSIYRTTIVERLREAE
jgi:putative ABC transport system permease protein